MNRQIDSSVASPQEKVETASLDEFQNIGVSAGGRRVILSDRTFFAELHKIVERVNSDSRFVKSLADFTDTTLVLSATDTGRELMIVLGSGRVSAHAHSDQPFDFKIQATEKVHWAVLSGQMGADTAFFAGKVRVCGSVLAAFRVKNRLLGLLQPHLARAWEESDKVSSEFPY